MVEASADIEDQIKQLDLQLKQKELEERSRWWNWLKTPPVIAAFITAWVALGSYVSSAVTARIQARSELQKFQASMLLSILTDNTPSGGAARGARVKIAIQSGMISDEDGRI